MKEIGTPLSEIPAKYSDHGDWSRLMDLCGGSTQRALVTLHRWCMPESQVPVQVQSPQQYQTQQDNDFRELIQLGQRLVSSFRKLMIAGDFESTATMPGMPPQPLSPEVWEMAIIDFESSLVRVGRIEYHDVRIRPKTIKVLTIEEQCEEFLRKSKAERPAEKKDHLRREARSLWPTLTDDEFNVIFKRVYGTIVGRRAVNRN